MCGAPGRPSKRVERPQAEVSRSDTFPAVKCRTYPGLENRETWATRQRRRRRSAQTDLFEHSAESVWQTRYYDFNVCTAHKRVEKLRYMHRNPVKRGLVEAPELWRWSSFRAYAYQQKGVVCLNDWSAHKLKFREVTTFPL